MAPPKHPRSGLKHPSREIVTKYLDYDPTVGIFRWKQTLGYKRKAGEIAGSIQPHLRGKLYRDIGLFRHVYRASNLAWLLMTGDWPAGEIDHINGDSTDDCWSNLRLATHGQNQANTKHLRSDNTSGYKGVSLDKRRPNKPWCAKIANRHIGNFVTPEDAARAYNTEAIRLYGEFAYLNKVPS